jgi:hypothetical protein
MIERLSIIADEVESAWPHGLDRRRMAYAISERAGLAMDALILGVGKGVVLSGPLAIKTGQPWQIEDSRQCAAILGKRFATVHASGKCWMIQERVKPSPDQRLFAAECRKMGVEDTRNNAGCLPSGELVAFDGFPTLKQRPTI